MLSQVCKSIHRNPPHTITIVPSTVSNLRRLTTFQKHSKLTKKIWISQIRSYTSQNISSINFETKVNQLIAQAHRVMDNSPEEAEMLLITSLQATRSSSNSPLKGFIHSLLGYAYQRLRKYQEAEANYKSSFSLLKESTAEQDQIRLGLSHSNLAEVYAHQAQYEEAIRQCKEAVAILSKLPDSNQNQTLLAITLNNLGGYMCAYHKFEEALSTYERAIAIFEKQNGKYSPWIQECLANLSRVYIKAGKDANQLKSSWQSKIKQEKEEIESAAVQNNNVDMIQSTWKDVLFRELDPPGFFLPKEILEDEKKTFEAFWNAAKQQ